MTKNELKDGMVVEVRKGYKYLVCGNMLIRDKGFVPMTDYCDDLKTTRNQEFDIIKVYEIVHCLDFNNLELLWERKDEHEPKVGDIYCSNDGEKCIIIEIDGDSNTVYPYLVMSIFKGIHESNVYSKSELKDYTYIGTDVNIASSFNLAFARLKDYNHEQI